MYSVSSYLVAFIKNPPVFKYYVINLGGGGGYKLVMTQGGAGGSKIVKNLMT